MHEVIPAVKRFEWILSILIEGKIACEHWHRESLDIQQFMPKLFN